MRRRLSEAETKKLAQDLADIALIGQELHQRQG